MKCAPPAGCHAGSQFLRPPPTSALFARRTLTIRRDYLHYIKKYNRFEKRHRNLSAHVSPAFRDIKLGDQVHVGQCRPLSKVGSPLVRTLASMAQICLPSPRMQRERPRLGS